MLGNRDTAIMIHDLSLELAKEIDHKALIAQNYYNLGINYDYAGNSSKAMEYFEISIEISQEIGNTVMTCNTYNSIASLYFRQGRF